MAKIGLQNFLYGTLTESGGVATYGAAKKPAKAISCQVSISSNDAKLYADDALAESDTSFQNGTVTIGLDEEDLQIFDKEQIFKRDGYKCVLCGRAHSWQLSAILFSAS